MATRHRVSSLSQGPTPTPARIGKRSAPSGEVRCAAVPFPCGCQKTWTLAPRPSNRCAYRNWGKIPSRSHVRFTPESGHNGARKKPSCTGHSFGVAEVLDCRRLRALLAPPSPALARRCRTARSTGFRLRAGAQAPMIRTATVSQSLTLAGMTGTGPGIASDLVAQHV